MPTLATIKPSRRWRTRGVLGIGREHTSGAKALFLWRGLRGQPEGLAYLEADRASARWPTHAMKPSEWGTRGWSLVAILSWGIRVAERKTVSLRSKTDPLRKGCKGWATQVRGSLIP